MTALCFMTSTSIYYIPISSTVCSVHTINKLFFICNKGFFYPISGYLG
jgi:hypothetical protein